MKNRTHGLNEKEMELVKLLMAECKISGDTQNKLKRLFAGKIEQMLEAEMDEHLGYEKNSVLGNNSGNSRNGYGKKTITSEYGECEIAVPRDRNGEFEPKIIEKRQTRTDESVLGINMDGQKEILGTWISENESASFYASICSDLKNRGVTDIFVACHDNLTGLCKAINSIFQKTKNQLCIVQQIRNSCKFVPYKDRKAVCNNLKKIYGAINLDDAEYAKEDVREKWDKKYPNILKSWDKN